MAANERKILTTLSIEDKAFKKAMNDAYSNLKVLSSELKSNAAAFDKDEKSVEGLTQKSDILSKKIAQQKEIVAALTRAVKESEAAGEENTKQTDQYRIKLNNAQAALSKMEKELESANKDLADAKSKTKALSDGLATLSTNLKNAGESMTKAGKTMSTYVTAPLVGAAAASAKLAADYEEAINKINTLDLGATSDKISGIRDDILGLSSDTGVSANEIGQATYQMASALGSLGDDVVEFVGVATQAAIGGFADAETAANGLTTVFNTFGYSTVEQMQKISDQMLTAQNLGKTTFGELAASVGNVVPIFAQAAGGTEELFASYAILTKNGIATTQATTGLKAAISNILKPTKDASDAAKKIGLDFSAAALNSKGWSGFLADVSEKTGGDTELMTQLFGSVEALNSMLVLTSEDGLEDFNDAMGEMRNSAGATEKAYDKMQGGFTASMNKALNSVKNLGIQIGTVVIPKIQPLLDWFKDAIQKLSEMDEGTINTILTIGGIVAAVGPVLVILGKLSTGIAAVSKALSFLVASPIGLTITAIAALTVGLVALSESMREHNVVAEQISTKAKQQRKEIEEQANAYNDLRVAQAEQASAGLAQIQYTQNLIDELKSLADEQGNVADKDRARVNYILNEVNEAYGTELQLINNNIAGYQAQISAIDDLVEKRKYEVVQAAALPLFEKALAEEIDVRMQKSRAALALEEAKSAQEAEYTKLVQKYGKERLDSWTFYEDGIAQIMATDAKGYNVISTNLELLQENYNNATKAVQQNLATQTSYIEAETLAQNGYLEEAHAKLNWFSSGLAAEYEKIKNDETARVEFFKKKYTEAEKSLQDYIDNVLLGVEEFNESTVRGLTANATDLYNKAKEAGVNIGDGLIYGMDRKQPGVTTSISTISDAIVTKLKDKMDMKSPSRVMNGLGKNIIQGLEDGMNEKKESASGTAAGIGSLLVQTFKNIFGIKSPSSVMRDQIGAQMMKGWAQGIEDNKGLVSNSFSGIVPETLNSALSLDVTSNFYDVARQAGSYGNERDRNYQGNIIDYERLGAAVAAAIPGAQFVINLDGKKVGYGAAPYVSDALSKNTRAMIRSGLSVEV